MASQLPPYLAPFQLLELNIISAQELCSVSRSMKTYAVAWVHPDRKLSTRVDPHGHANPTWNDKFVFRVDDFFLQNELSAVMIEIYATNWWRDVLVGTVRVLIGNLIPSSQSKQSNLGRHQLGMTFVALQVKRPSGRPQGILNIGVGLLDSSMRSMPLYSQLSSSAVGYRDLMGEDDPLHHHTNNQQKHQIVQNYHHHDSLVQRPELRRTRSDTSSMVFDQPMKNAAIVKPKKKGKASSWISGSTSEFGNVKDRKKASSMISGASNKETKGSERVLNKQPPPALITKTENATSGNPVVNTNPPKGIICKPQLKREPSMKRVTIGEPVIIKETVIEKLKEPESKTLTSSKTKRNDNQQGKVAEVNNESNNKSGHENKANKDMKERPISPPTMKLVPPPPPPEYTPLPPPMYTPLQKLEVEKKQTLDMMMMLKPYNITDSELGPSPSEVEAAIRANQQHKNDDKGSSILSGWSLSSSVEGLQSKLDRWRAELPTVYDKSEYVSDDDDVVVPVVRPKSSSSMHKRRRRDRIKGDQEGAVSCFSSICGIHCSISCGTKAKPVKKKGASGRARARTTPVDNDSVLFY